MVKGVAIKFKSYHETVPQILKLIKLHDELKKHQKIIIKPTLVSGSKEASANTDFVEAIVKFCNEHKEPAAELVIAEGCDGADTKDVFDEMGYRSLSERYRVGLVDLNKTETTTVMSPEFLRFEKIMYPNVLKNDFVITVAPLRQDAEIQVSASLDSMLGAFPARHYKGVFSSKKNKIANIPKKYQVHDILKCKMPELAIVDASSKNVILAGQPTETDKQAAKLLGMDWRNVSHLRLIDESFAPKEKAEQELI